MDGLKRWEHRLEKYINLQEDYVEKLKINLKKKCLVPLLARKLFRLVQLNFIGSIEDCMYLVFWRAPSIAGLHQMPCSRFLRCYYYFFVDCHRNVLDFLFSVISAWFNFVSLSLTYLTWVPPSIFMSTTFMAV